jgi:hypothetical protein
MDELRWYWDQGLRRCDDCEEEVLYEFEERIYICIGCGRTATHG